MPILTKQAPAKINLCLQVKNRRSDGYHDLESIFLALDFCDTLQFEPIDRDGEPHIDMDGSFLPTEPEKNLILTLPPSKNIIYKAVNLFRERTGYAKSLKIRAEKRIPPGAGLGGGSSDAASTLLALNSLAAQASIPGVQPLKTAELMEMGALLGSDVPFFLAKCPAARISGRGEIIQPIKIPSNLWVILVKPDFSIDTAEAYRKLDDFRGDLKEGIRDQGSGIGGKDLVYGIESPEFYERYSDNDIISRFFSQMASIPPRSLIPDPRSPFQNDFLPVFLADTALGPVFRDLLGQLEATKADFFSLSGSGATCFGVFTDQEKARKAYEALHSKYHFVQLIIPLEIETIPV
ncbi:MAG: 4-(cytidine 5'-diphospho)-2-C-methyl-D-erythritol kinase [Treponema sp.]|nr:4-(cytidine 5'-diphospho)-2-C-methyl-D-erythritol kinase [Treponema sp.]